MANLGTLWFGSDIDISGLKRKIQQGNKEILDALKIKYDEQSYNRMVANLRSRLKNENFEIGITINQAKVSKSVQAALSQAGLGANVSRSMLSSARLSAAQTKTADQHAIAMARLARAQNSAARATNNHARAALSLNTKLGHGVSIGGRFSEMVAGLWTVGQAKNFAQQLIEIGGQFQKNRVALESMLGSLAKADAMYERMKGLAVESPFTFSDLMSYTKQLSAFQIPYEEIYDTTKRLADISAGLGVDMSRIILAYGQVRSAAFLRGQEVRQFTEAGIPLLDALAKKFSELENRVVSTGEVFEKISKRQVSFQMVKDVLWELTDEGGKFYNMQSKLTDTLAGKLAKLRDTYEIAMGDMAQGNNKALGALLDTLTALAKNIDIVASVLGTAAGAWLIYNMAVKTVATWNMAGLFIKEAIATKKLADALAAATAQQKALNTAAKANYYVIMATVVLSLAMAFRLFSSNAETAADKLRDLNREHQKDIDLINENSQRAQSYIKTLKDENASLDKQKLAYQNLQTIYPDLFGKMDIEQAKRLSNIKLLNMESEAAKKSARNKLLSYKADLKTLLTDAEDKRDKYQNMGFWGYWWKYDAFVTKKKANAALAKMRIDAQQTVVDIQSQISDVDKALGDLDKKDKQIADNRTAKWYKAATKLAKDAKNIAGNYAPGASDTFEDYFDRIKKDLNSENSLLKALTPNAPIYKDVKARAELLSNIYHAIGGADEGLKGHSSSKKDTRLEDLKSRVALYKRFFSELQKAKELYGEEGALEWLKDLGFSDVFNWGLKDVTNFGKSLDHLTKGFEANTKERRDFINQTDADKVSQFRKEEEQSIKSYVDQLDRMLEVMRNGYDTYKKWYELTGDANLAERLSGVSSSKTYAKYLEEEIRKALSLRGSKYSLDKVLGMNEAEIINKFGKDSVILKFWKSWDENNKKLRADNLKLFEDSIKAAQRYEDKVANINRELERQISAIKAMPISDYEKNRLITNARTNTDKALSKAAWDNFKETHDWGRVFADLNSISMPTLHSMIKAMQQFNDVESLSIEETKAWYEAMQKLLDRKAVLEPMKAIADYARQMQTNRDAMADAEAKISIAEANIARLEELQRTEPTFNERELADARKAYNKELDNYNSLLDREQQLVAQMQKAVQALGSSISQLGSDISQLGSDIGGNMGNVLSGFGGMIGSLGKAFTAASNERANMKGFMGLLGKTSVVLGLSSAMIQMNKALAKMLPSVEKLYEKHAEEVCEMSQLKNTIAGIELSEEKRNAEIKKRGGNALSNLIADAGVQGKAGMAYWEKMYSPQAAYIDKQAKWKKWIGPVLGAIGGIVAGIFTFGVGTVITSFVAAALTEAVSAGVGAAVGVAATAAGNAISYNLKEGEVLTKDNLRIETRKAKFFKSQRTQDLESWVRQVLGKELFYGEDAGMMQGFINPEVVDELIKGNYNLVGATRETITELAELSKEFREYLDNVSEYVGDRFSPIVDNMTDALWDFVADGEDAMDKFHEYASDTFKNVAKDMVKSFLNVTIIKPLMDELGEIYANYSLAKNAGKGVEAEIELIDNVARIAGEFGDKYSESLPVLEKIVQTIIEKFSAQGYDNIFESSKSSSASGSIKSITENTADLLASYINAIRADVAMNRADFAVYLPQFSGLLSQTNAIAQVQVTIQQQIAANTLRNADAAQEIRDIMHRVENGATSLKIR